MTIEEDKAELKELVRQMHEAMKDTRVLLKEMRAVKSELLHTADEVFNSRMEESVTNALNEYSETIGKAIEDSTDAVMKRFDTISNVLLHGDTKGRGENILEQAAIKKRHQRN